MMNKQISGLVACALFAAASLAMQQSTLADTTVNAKGNGAIAVLAFTVCGDLKFFIEGAVHIRIFFAVSHQPECVQIFIVFIES